MGHQCCVPHCTASSRHAGVTGITFHSFPVDPKERKEWILCVRRADYKKLTVNKHTKVCSKHFKPEDFIQPQGTKRRLLKKGVVPSIFSWTQSNGVGSSNKKNETTVKESEKKKDRNTKKDNESTTTLDLSTSNPDYGSPSKSDDSEQGSISDLTATNGSSPVSSTNGASRRKMSNINFQIGRYDEWIPMDSSRLRPTDNPGPQNDGKSSSKVFNVGDRVMAKWSDCRRYPATVKTILPNDKYEVLFFDGFTKIIKGIRMTKLEGVAENVPEVKPEVPEKKLPPPVSKPVVKNTVIEEAIGTKEERRERKRKINVAELFHPKKRIKLEPGSTPPRVSSEPEKGKKIEKGKKRKENSSEGAENEGEKSSVSLDTNDSVEDSVQGSELEITMEEKKVDEETVGKPKKKNSSKSTGGGGENGDKPRRGLRQGETQGKAKSVEVKSQTRKIQRKISPGGRDSPSTPKLRRDSSKGFNFFIVLFFMVPINICQHVCSGKLSFQFFVVIMNIILLTTSETLYLYFKTLYNVFVAQTEDNETPKGRKKEHSEESSKSATKASNSKDVEKEGDSKWKRDNQEEYIVDSIDGPRKTTIIPDKNLPAGWTKHTIQRKHGNSAGKWDVLLVNPQGRRFRSRSELRQYFEETGEPFKAELFDFCVTGKKRSRASDGDVPKRKRSRGGKKSKLPIGPGGDAVEQHTSQQDTQAQPLLPSHTLAPQRRVKTLLPKIRRASTSQSEEDNGDKTIDPPSPPPPYTTTVASVPAIKIEPEMLEGEDGCGKNFRKENLLQMHLKHYHPEYNKFMGSTPNVADLAYARTIGESIDDLMPKSRYSSGSSSNIGSSTYSEKTNRFEGVRKSKSGTPASAGSSKSSAIGGGGDGSTVPEKKKVPSKEKVQNTSTKKSAKGISADTDGRIQTDDSISDTKEPKDDKTAVLENRETISTPVADISTSTVHREEKKEPQTTIKTLLPVIRSPTQVQESSAAERLKSKIPAADEGEEYIEVIDVGSKSTQPVHGTGHTPSSQSMDSSTKETTSFTKSRTIRRRRLSDFHFEPLHKRRKIATKLEITEDVDVVNDNGSPVDVVSTPTGAATTGGTLSNGKSTPTTYRYSRKKTPVVHLEKLNVTPDSNAELTPAEQLRKEELINCTCGFMEEDGLMIQCDLCLCWQHGICNNIEKETEVPEKYVCPICLNPYRQRNLTFRSKNEANIADREAILKRSHDLTGSLLQIQQVLHSLRVKVNIAGKSDHPKLYLWAKSWEKDGESSSNISSTQASGTHAQICADGEFKSELDTAPCSTSEIKTELPSSIVTETSTLDHKDLVSDLQISEKGLPENEVSVKCDSEIKQPQIKAERIENNDKGPVIQSSSNKSDATRLLTDEQQIIEETIVTEVAAEHSVSSENTVKIEEKVDSELVAETAGKESITIDNEVECTSEINSTENKEIHSLSENSSNNSAITKSLETTIKTEIKKEELDVQDSIEEVEVVTDKPTSQFDPFTKDTVEEADNKAKTQFETTSENEASLIDDNNVQTTVEVTDSSIPSTPDVVLKESDTHLADESTNASTCSKPLDTDETSLDNHGLLHQALTNGSHSTNPLNGGLGNQIDASSHPMLQLPICQSELMQFASKSSRPAVPVPVPEPPRVPQPEAPIDPVECRLLLLDHIDHFQQQIDTRLTMLEEQVAALESQDPDAAKDEAADHYPQTKQTIQMLLRDLLTMRKLSALN
ncbi:hypothetical protein C0J52_02156 [Blattella germanica]|nr:hypothetical protein C0J52_02156 [Blattella germanica]